MFRNLLIVALVLLFAMPSVMADRRKYVWTYQYSTVAPDAAEIEFYQTTKIKPDNPDSWEYRIEVEHGLTPNWDMALYQIFAQTEGGNLMWDAFQFRVRGKLAQPGKLFMDPLIYLEYRRKVGESKQNKLEAKLILARDFDRVNLSLNPVYEFFWAPGATRKQEIGLDAGISYELNYKFSIGLESTTRIEYIDGKDTETGSYFGPSMSFATGDIFYSVGYGFGITDDSDDGRVRLIMGVGL